VQGGRRRQVPKPIQLLFGLFGAAALTWSQSGPIVVWKVGSPYGTDAPDTATPQELAWEAESIGTSLRIVGLPAKGFAERFFRAIETGDEPDILVIDNYGLIQGVTTDLGSFTGINSNQLVKKSLINVTQTLEAFQGLGRGMGIPGGVLTKPHCCQDSVLANTRMSGSHGQCTDGQSGIAATGDTGCHRPR
jgi:hypothetical protein